MDTNKLDRVIGFIFGGVAGFFASIANPSLGGAVGVKVLRDTCPYKKYICIDCKKGFQIQNG